MTKIYDEIPVNLLKFYYQVWELEDMSGDFPVNEFCSSDEYGEQSLTRKISNVLIPFIEDANKRNIIAEAIESWLYDESYVICDDEDMKNFIEDEL